jgi:signal recognition particle subunit SEC65
MEVYVDAWEILIETSQWHLVVPRVENEPPRLLFLNEDVWEPLPPDVAEIARELGLGLAQHAPVGYPVVAWKSQNPGIVFCKQGWGKGVWREKSLPAGKGEEARRLSKALGQWVHKKRKRER